MGFLIGLLTFFMVLDCLALILLVLVQLPKKEAGAGLAFGGAASDALFGAGSGTVLTKITKYFATGFFILAVILAVLQSRYHNASASALAQRLAEPEKVSPGAFVPPVTPTAPTSNGAAATPAVPLTNLLNAQPESTNIPILPTPPAGTNTALPK